MSSKTIEQSLMQTTPETESLPEVRLGAVGVSYDELFGTHLLVVTVMDGTTCSVVELKDDSGNKPYSSSGTKEDDEFLAIIAHEPVEIVDQIIKLSNQTSPDPTLAKELLGKYRKTLEDMDEE